MHQYEQFMRDVQTNGVAKGDRTGTGTKSLFGCQMRFNLQDGFPLVTTKKIHFKSVVAELLWILSGSTNNNDLVAMGCTIWNEWAKPDGDLGPIYGHQMRRFGSKPDQIVQPKPRLRAGLLATYLGVGTGVGGAGHPLKKTWEGMMARCYDTSSISYPEYGARGVYVCNEWLEFSRFAEDAARLPGWSFKQETDARCVLDKDVIGNGFAYGPDTCCWVTDRENAIATSKVVHTVEKDGQLFSFICAKTFCEQHGVASPENFSDLWTGNKNAKIRGGFSYVGSRPINPGVDQIAEVVDGIRRDPNGRRHVVSCWNPVDVPHMALAPCHALFQFDVSGGRLSCQLYQRSADVLLGVPFNIASYSLLTHMVAQQCGLEVGDFIWTGGDCHIYSNHDEQVRLQLSREPFPFPELRLLRQPDSLFDYRPEDFELLNYQHHPAIKAPVAI